MANDSITFSCPACGVKLTVPGNLAGVIGPCPTCRNTIQAPYPAPVRIVPPISAPVQPIYPPQQVAPGYADAANYASAPIANPAPTHSPAPAVQAPLQPPELPVTPAVLRPEPRQLPHRSSHGEPVAKQMPESNRVIETPQSSQALPRPPHRRSRSVRFLMPLFFLIASGAISFGVFTVLKNQTKETGAKSAKKDPSLKSSVLPEDHFPTNNSKLPDPESPPSLPVQTPEQPAIVEPAPLPPEGIEPTTPDKEAEETLDKFLSAKSLAERIPLIETQTPESDLMKSCLAGPLPAASNILTDAKEGNAMEQVIDIYYNVDFAAGNNPLNPQTILVRKRGSNAPKIVVDPFLDSYGGRLAAYAKAPSEKSGTFEVIIYAVASCNDEKVPNREKKLTLKLLPRDNTKEIARAYFGRQSKIGMMLEDGTYSLSYGKAKACTVILRWNVEDNPQFPYLEAIDLKTLDWNP